MSQVGNVQVAWQKRRRRLGDSVPGCLLFIAVVIGGSIWAYFQFVHWRPLARAGNNNKNFQQSKNWPAYLEYGRRFRTGFKFGVKAMCTQNYTMIKRFKQGDFKDSPDQFDNEAKEYMNQLLESVIQFDGQEVPIRLDKPHKKISKAHGLCYESILFLKDANKAEGVERAQLVKEAEKKAKEAWTIGQSGVREMEHIWNTTGTTGT
ncbi:hypothetical protein IV102_31245 [bacterium]|nr:hypothetical protein [bacterium]